MDGPVFNFEKCSYVMLPRPPPGSAGIWIATLLVPNQKETRDHGGVEKRPPLTHGHTRLASIPCVKGRGLAQHSTVNSTTVDISVTTAQYAG